MRLSVLLLCSIVLANPFSVQADDTSGIDILKSMAEASRKLNYEGVFAYQSGPNSQSIRIYHRADARGERERMIALSGAAREVIRTNDMVTCINPEDNKVNVSRRPFGRGFPSDLPRRLSSATPYYKVEVGESERVADRHATQLLITPVDAYRYGYRLWVDQESHLLLKSELLNSEHHVLESFEFSAVNTGVHIPEHKLQPHTDGETMSWHTIEPEKMVSNTEGNMSDWRFDWLPDGFSLVAFQTRLRAKNGAYVEQRVFSDGLSSVSVFIEKIRAHHTHLHGGSHVGAINAYGRILNAHFVTVVGEVPAATVDRIGNAIRYAKSDIQP